MEEFDGVILIKDYNNLKKGTKGTIVHKYNDDVFIVEFFDNNHDSIDVFTISRDYLQVYWKISEH